MGFPLQFYPDPLLNMEPRVSCRDPAVIFHNGVFRCFYSAVERKFWKYTLYLDVITSKDLISWSTPKRVYNDAAGYSSPGNVFFFDGRWYICFQTYPVPRFMEFANQNARLWLASSKDLVNWDTPRAIKPEGCTARWASSRRQIDPYIVHYDEKWWCFYKANGALGLLMSKNLDRWVDASPDHPVLSRNDTPDKVTIENPCVIQDDEGHFIMFFSPCRYKRGIGMARSSNLLEWHDLEYIDFPEIQWAPNGPSAPFVFDARQRTGKWLMFYHGEIKRPHAAALGIAWSENLKTWITPGKISSQLE